MCLKLNDLECNTRAQPTSYPRTAHILGVTKVLESQGVKTHCQRYPRIHKTFSYNNFNCTTLLKSPKGSQAVLALGRGQAAYAFPAKRL